MPLENIRKIGGGLELFQQSYLIKNWSLVLIIAKKTDGPLIQWSMISTQTEAFYPRALKDASGGISISFGIPITNCSASVEQINLALESILAGSRSQFGVLWRWENVLHDHPNIALVCRYKRNTATQITGNVEKKVLRKPSLNRW